MNSNKSNSDSGNIRQHIEPGFTDKEDTCGGFDTEKFSSLKLLCSVLKYTCLMDSTMKILSLSYMMAEELGHNRDELIGKNFLTLIDDSSGDYQKAVVEVLKGREKTSANISYKHEKGSTTCTPVNLIPVEIDTERMIFLYIDNFLNIRSLLERERNERVKELKCLYLITNEMKETEVMDELLLNVSGHINNAMQFTDITSTVITLNGREYSKLSIDKPIIRSIEEYIFVRGERRGSITVNYHDNLQFMEEEYDLISSIAKMFGRVAERFELQEKKEQYMKNLELLVEERVKDLEKSRRRYKTLFDNAPSGIFISPDEGEIISNEEGEIITANRAFYRMLKYPEDGSVKPHIIKDNLYSSQKDRRHIFQQVKNQGYLTDYEFDLKALDGSIITVSGSSIKYEEDGKIYYETMLKDITEKKKLERKLLKQKEHLEDMVEKRTEVLARQRDKLMVMNRKCKNTSEELRRSINKMQTLFNAITDTVISIDKDFRILMSNRSQKNIGEKCHKILFNSNEPCRKCPALQAISKKKPASIEVMEGDRYYQLQCYPIFDENGNVEGVIEWAKDITRDKNLCDQMLQADRLASLGQLVSGIGHEINNPNTFILGNMKIFHEAFADIMPIMDKHFEDHPDFKIARLKYPFFREHVNLLMDDMVSGAERIKTIVQDLKKFARKSDSNLNDLVSINNIVERSVRLVHNQVKRKARIKIQPGDDIPDIKANSVGLEQVLVNLIINASDSLKNGEKGNINITTEFDKAGNKVVLTVYDDGIGMDETTVRKIFDPFFTTKRNRGGTGLGLSIAYRIIKEHEGDIEVESKPGEGTTFRIEIPVN